MSAYLFGPSGDEAAPSPRLGGNSWRNTLRIAAPWILCGVLAAMLGYLVLAEPGAAPAPPDGGIDGRFVAIGNAHAGRLGQEYADAWDDGARILDAGQPVATAIDTVAKAWEANRVSGFDRFVTPEFSKVLPQSKNEKDVTAAERAALARAWRGFAKGLRAR